MKRKTIWLMLGCLIVVAMVLGSCGPAEVEEEEGKTVVGEVTEVEEEEEEEEEEAVAEVAEEAAGWPQHGGILNVYITSELGSYDSWSATPMYFSNMIYDQLAQGDITITEDVWPFYGNYLPAEHCRGMIAESWEQPDPSTIIFKLRKGVRFQDLPPVYGRECVADDVVYTFERLLRPESPADVNVLKWIEELTALDKYTVKFVFNPPQVQMWTKLTAANPWIIPHEVEEEYGDLSEPLTQVGTGPFIITDHVVGSSLTYIRNPNYWEKDPRYPDLENTLPYIDGVNQMIIPDEATRLAGLRTGKLDLSWVNFRQAESLDKSNPELQKREMIAENFNYMAFRNDLEPYSDVRVRQALSMAIDRNAILDKYLDGHGVYTNYPIPEAWTGIFIPLDERPAGVRKILEYHPDESKALLAEAGYPDGFKTEVMVSSTMTDQVEILQLIKQWWADIGVDLDINVMDDTTKLTYLFRHTYEHIIHHICPVVHPVVGFSWNYQEPGEPYSVYNIGQVTDTVYNEKYTKAATTFDPDEFDKAHTDLYLYLAEHVYWLEFPYINNYQYWQPWLQGFWGQFGLKYVSSGNLYKYFWIDSDLKSEMGH